MRDQSICCYAIGTPRTDGYCKVRRGRLTLYAHRDAWEKASGAPVPPGMFVGHTCDANYAPGDTSYRRCVRADDVGTYLVNGKLVPRFGHLWLGTNEDNMADMVAKGRTATGHRNGNHTRPDRRPRGQRHGRYTHPERTARGAANGRHLGESRS